MTRLSGQDAAFLAFESPGRPMHVAVVATFARSAASDAARLRDALARRLATNPLLGRRLERGRQPRWTAAPDFDPKPAIEFWNMTNEQDWMVSRLSQEGIASRAYTPGPYAELESMIAAWDREYLRALAE